MADLKTLRRNFAEEVRAASRVRSEAVIRAFATVPREKFLGPGPWRLVGPTGYQITEDDDPRHLYRNVPVALDSSRNLNNGQPEFLAILIDALDIREGDHVVHLGCGVGYYTAIIAESVGANGRVTAIEADAGLAARAHENLTGYPQIKVVSADGSTQSVDAVDAFLVNAGATHPLPLWLDSLRLGARLILPLTLEGQDEESVGFGMGMGLLPPGIGAGKVLKVIRGANGYAATFVSGVQVFHCIGARSERGNDLLRDAFRSGSADTIRSLRRDIHKQSESCWLHGDGYCLSTSLPGAY